MYLDFLYPTLFLLALGGVPSGVEAAKPNNAILLSEVQSLTLRGDRQTAHRRVPAAPQLKCISHKSICALHKIDVMRCVNQGSGYSSEDIQWSCTAELPRELKLGSTDVICEGYSSADDPYVLKGSCGVEYRLVLTDEGEKRHPDLGGHGGGIDTAGLGPWIFWIIFVGVLLFIIYSACNDNGGQPGARRAARRNNWGGGGGGGWGPGWGGGGGWADPPPPYPGTKYGSSEGWRPGFGSGLAAGAAAGYMAGRGGRNDNGSGGGSFWGGSGGAGPSRSSGSSASSSSSRHESTGFGSTSRR